MRLVCRLYGQAQSESRQDRSKRIEPRISPLGKCPIQCFARKPGFIRQCGHAAHHGFDVDTRGCRRSPCRAAPGRLSAPGRYVDLYIMAGTGLSTVRYRAMGLARENATSFFMQRILFLQLSHSPWLHSKDLHSNSHCESSGGVFATKGPLIKFLNPSSSLVIPPPSWRNAALIDNSPYYSPAAQPHFVLVRGIPWNIRSAVVAAIHPAERWLSGTDLWNLVPAEGLLGFASPLGGRAGARSTSLRDVVEPGLVLCRGFDQPVLSRVGCGGK